MRPSLKALCCGAAMVLAMSAMSAIGASAQTGGHFTSAAKDGHTLIESEPTGEHQGSDLVFTVNGEKVTCEIVKHFGTTTSATVTEVVIGGEYSECTHSIGATAHVSMNGCAYIFTIGKSSVEDNTLHLVCEGITGPHITVTGPFGNCTIEITPNQTLVGVSYTTANTQSVHAITANVTVSSIHTALEGGFFKCGTSSKTVLSELHGSATVWGRNTKLEKVAITATGSEGGSP